MSPNHNTKKRSHQIYLEMPQAIFIHAGAGYHSIQNEKMHLTVCSKAANEGMKILKAGGTAVEAVEAAIKLLEDNEITNAGFGSNLTIDGTVEGDATVVDHLGRSGACGAVPSIDPFSSLALLRCFSSMLMTLSMLDIKNPISLARCILDNSSKTLTLRRVPPNFLVGEGAKRFGMDHGITVVTNEALVSRNARDRYQKWRADLDKVERSESTCVSPMSTSSFKSDTAGERHQTHDPSQESMVTPTTQARKGVLRDHTTAIMTGLWNEGQPDSPTSETRSPLEASSNKSLRSGRISSSPVASPVASLGTPVKRVKTSRTARGRKAVADADGVANFDGTPFSRLDVTELTAEPTAADQDMIMDTIGAIAIDMYGNIAAGSSSGGIGIKHMGRTGPAALVGVGTAVVPRDGADKKRRTVATVTSGTGEHMATTMAAQKCADRIYHGTCRGDGGCDQKEDDCAAILKSFVEKDFMDHPGVRNQASIRAIGVMAVEVTSSGCYVHWVHNTESFALASMSSNDRQPLTVMSRLPEGAATINIGGRKVHYLETESETESDDGSNGDAGW
ncbi:hypothetical protein N0V82_008119 [Gnomoniopsis sp. IMI 355080]|nr:hypothetical protein N0V82_008119 [Gnomoniopsis sp. IMI 355080]